MPLVNLLCYKFHYLVVLHVTTHVSFDIFSKRWYIACIIVFIVLSPSDRAVTTVGVDEDDDDVLAAGLDSAGGLNADLNDDCIGLGCAGGGKPRSA